MRLTITEIQVMELFINDIFIELSINEIAKRLKKHYRVIRVNVLSLLKKKLLNGTVVAGAKIISLNLKEVQLPMYMTYIEEVATYHQIYKVLPHIEEIIEKAQEISPFFCLGIFGSYAKGAQKKDSDIDFFLMCNESKVKEYKLLIRKFPSIENIIDWNVFSIDEFKEGLKTKGTLVYKEIANNKRIIKGADIFYNILAEVGAIEN